MSIPDISLLNNLLTVLLSFRYTIPIFLKGRKKEIDFEDMYDVLDAHKSDMLGDRLSASWEKELVLAKAKNKEPSLLRATLRVFGLRLAMIGLLLCFIEFVFR